ncbi:hypothetical protein N7486_006817 [Penicillium sp. IBT 16267x]|nr:hypothetical protein N7486_006817 [Penicillium sp. IBT 16267x]
MMPVMAGAESVATSTTTIQLMERLITENMTLLEGSVISADATATTLELDCKASASSICTSSGMLLPQTVTVGPSIQGMNFDITTYWGSTLWIVSGRASCVVTNTSMGADCVLTTSSWYSAGTTVNSSSVDGTTVTVSPTLAFATIPVVSGLNKLAAATTTDASPASAATTTSAPNTGTATATSRSSTFPSSSSSSNAWIAGPVVGAIAGIAFVGALAFWYFRRTRKNTGDAEGANSAGAKEAGGADWERRGELQGTYEPPELQSNAPPSELQSDAARAELPATQLDLDKKREMETRHAASELP